MTTPQTTAALEAMQADAVQWRHIAAEMREAARAVGQLGLGAVEFSFVANLLGMVDLYRETQERIVALLGEAERTQEWLGLALDSAAEAYYVDDVEAAHRLRQIP